MNANEFLPIEVENILNEYIFGNLNDVFAKYQDEPIRERVLDLLDTLCIVVYYPLKNEGNNGFHVTNMPFANGEKHNFVYINTAQTLERQVFTAAHELGHILEVDDHVLKKISKGTLEDNDDIREAIINRFAASLLMPSKIFKDAWNEEYIKYKDDDGNVTIINLLRIIVVLMDRFFAPIKAIIFRLVELEIVAPKVKDLLLGDEIVPQEVLRSYVQKLISDYGFIQFQNPTNKKWIEGFAERLDEAEQKGVVLESKINKIRNLFEFKNSKITFEMNSDVQIKSQEGKGTQ